MKKNQTKIINLQDASPNFISELNELILKQNNHYKKKAFHAYLNGEILFDVRYQNGKPYDTYNRCRLHLINKMEGNLTYNLRYLKITYKISDELLNFFENFGLHSDKKALAEEIIDTLIEQKILEIKEFI